MAKAAGHKSNKKVNGLMPRSQMPLRTLMIAMTVMCYLACLAIGALILITKAVDEWSSDISGQVTVQVRPDGKTKMPDKLKTVEVILKNTIGVTAVDILPKEAGAKLLEPWLGNADILDQLPVPRLVAVTIDRETDIDFDKLAAQLKTQVKGASLDTHRRWQAELTRMGATLVWLGVAVLVLITGSAIALVIYASRSALDANRQVVEVLHLVGASDPYIARQVQWQFLRAGLFSGLVGTLAGMVTFLVIGLKSSKAAADGLADASYSLLVGAPDVTLTNYLLFLLVPIIATLICLVAARIAILRILSNAI
jgi:cell division transport system permease protein